MSEEKKELLVEIAEKFKELDDTGKAFIAGYMAGKQDEKERKQTKELQTA